MQECDKRQQQSDRTTEKCEATGTTTCTARSNFT